MRVGFCRRFVGRCDDAIAACPCCGAAVHGYLDDAAVCVSLADDDAVDFVERDLLTSESSGCVNE